jgi:general secretion pathway protein J
MNGARVSRIRSRGFTLVELLVALTITALVAGLLTNSLSFSLGTAETVEARILDMESFHQAQRAFRRQVQLALPVETTDDIDDVRMEFAANAAQLDFIAPMPGLVLGGLPHRVSMRIDEQSGTLIMAYIPHIADSRSSGAVLEPREHVLLEGISDASFSYLDTLSLNSTAWVDEWRHTSRLPDLVRLRVTFDGQVDESPAELIVAIKAPLPVHLGDL